MCTVGIAYVEFNCCLKCHHYNTDLGLKQIAIIYAKWDGRNQQGTNLIFVKQIMCHWMNDPKVHIFMESNSEVLYRM